eukprot:gene3266-2248_t
MTLVIKWNALTHIKVVSRYCCLICAFVVLLMVASPKHAELRVVAECLDCHSFFTVIMLFVIVLAMLTTMWRRILRFKVTILVSDGARLWCDTYDLWFGLVWVCVTSYCLNLLVDVGFQLLLVVSVDYIIWLSVALRCLGCLHEGLFTCDVYFVAGVFVGLVGDCYFQSVFGIFIVYACFVGIHSVKAWLRLDTCLYDAEFYKIVCCIVLYTVLLFNYIYCYDSDALYFVLFICDLLKCCTNVVLLGYCSFGFTLLLGLLCCLCLYGVRNWIQRWLFMICMLFLVEEMYHAKLSYTLISVDLRTVLLKFRYELLVHFRVIYVSVYFVHLPLQGYCVDISSKYDYAWAFVYLPLIIIIKNLFIYYCEVWDTCFGITCGCFKISFLGFGICCSVVYVAPLLKFRSFSFWVGVYLQDFKGRFRLMFVILIGYSLWMNGDSCLALWCALSFCSRCIFLSLVVGRVRLCAALYLCTYLISLALFVGNYDNLSYVAFMPGSVILWCDIECYMVEFGAASVDMILQFSDCVARLLVSGVVIGGILIYYQFGLWFILRRYDVGALFSVLWVPFGVYVGYTLFGEHLLACYNSSVMLTALLRWWVVLMVALGLLMIGCSTSGLRLPGTFLVYEFGCWFTCAVFSICAFDCWNFVVISGWCLATRLLSVACAFKLCVEVVGVLRTILIGCVRLLICGCWNSYVSCWWKELTCVSVLWVCCFGGVMECSTCCTDFDLVAFDDEITCYLNGDRLCAHDVLVCVLRVWNELLSCF